MENAVGQNYFLSKGIALLIIVIEFFFQLHPLLMFFANYVLFAVNCPLILKLS